MLDTGDIDVADLLALLNMFNISRYSGMTSFPINSYSSKKKCIDLYILDHKQYGGSGENPYVKMTNIMPDIFRLYDAIEVGMNRFYRQKTLLVDMVLPKAFRHPNPGRSSIQNSSAMTWMLHHLTVSSTPFGEHSAPW